MAIVRYLEFLNFENFHIRPSLFPDLASSYKIRRNQTIRCLVIAKTMFSMPCVRHFEFKTLNSGQIVFIKVTI